MQSIFLSQKFQFIKKFFCEISLLFLLRRVFKMKPYDWSVVTFIRLLIGYHFENPPREILFEAFLKIPLDVGG